ncbi:MAG TPA: NAD(P)/FAD-dependent oxidoreductase [Candidatus Nanoarchaeia archaeon]|nr:NAD(P)/FAD-dependent oxidoreductase [Candidatus Nanoarchaeia archaeon]
MTTVTVIGAGPAGGFSAYLLAKAGMDVRVFEEHGTIGEPVACTGVITADVMAQRLQLPKELIVNRVAKARIFAPNGQSVEIKLKNDIIIDRAGFDRYVSGMAMEAGVKYFTSHRFESFEHSSESGGNRSESKKIVVAVKDKAKNEIKKIETDFLIGADGPISSVAKTAGLFGNREFYTGIQVTIPVPNDNIIGFYPSEQGIAWVVPENESISRVGIAAKKEANTYFRKFITAAVGEGYEKKIMSWQAGPIPIYGPKLKTATKDGKVLLVGDAATMVKAPTLGGINQSLIGAEAAAESITRNADYENLWKKKMGMDLYLSLLMRKAMERFTDNDYNMLVAAFAKEKNRKVLESYDRDTPSKFALKLLIKEPKLLLFAKKAWF